MLRVESAVKDLGERIWVGGSGFRKSLFGVGIYDQVKGYNVVASGSTDQE